jgi:hypothetical protein
MAHKIKSVNEFLNESDDNLENINIDETVLDELVDLVGSEEDIENAAELALSDLQKAFDKNEIEIKEGDIPETLALVSLIVKLVELGKLGPEEADAFIEGSLFN